jgi:hypothetical protein
MRAIETFGVGCSLRGHQDFGRAEAMAFIRSFVMMMALALFFYSAADSPYIVPVAGCMMVLGIVVAGIWSSVREREMLAQERLAAIARGIPIPPTEEELAIMHGKPLSDAARRRDNIRLAAIILLCSAGGLSLFFFALAAVLQVRAVLCGAAVGLIPLGVGVGLYLDARVQTRVLEEAEMKKAGV